MKFDCLVLGAGMVGVGAALHLQKRGRTVALIDRRSAAEETSYGNAGIIQKEAVVPYAFPRDIAKLAQYLFNRLPEANIHWSALPSIAPWVYRYWRQSTPERIAQSARGAKPLVERAILEHEALMQEAGAAHMIRRTGYLRVYRSEEKLAEALAKEEQIRATYGVKFEPQTKEALRQLEPHLDDTLVGGILMAEPASVADPGALGKAYADLFVSRGGTFLTADARTLEQTADGWLVRSVTGPITAREVIVALGPWSDEVLGRIGVSIPLAVKRGYHVHFRPRGNATLSRPVLDAETGYVLAPMARGIRLTTGAEFARRDSPPTPLQLKRVEPVARTLFPLADAVDEKPWMGARPCFPDMLPMVGPVKGRKGLWLDCGHHHLGFTMGPVTGRLIAEMVTGEATFTDPFPYRTDRFA